MISRSSVRQEIMKPGRKKKKIKKVLGEFKRKKLKSSSGKKVTKHKQAITIALNSKRKRRKS
jgi:hypothetical protein